MREKFLLLAKRADRATTERMIERLHAIENKKLLNWLGALRLYSIRPQASIPFAYRQWAANL